VTAADVSTSTGLPLNEVIRELNKVAADTHAVLQVSKTGTIAYVFPSDPDAIYRATGARKALLQTLGRVRDILGYIARCSFGLLLIASIITLFIIFTVAILLSLFAADAADGELDFEGEFDGSELEFNFFDVANLAMFFTWWHRDVSGEVVYYGKKIETRQTGFVSNCFSFLFGDRDPNRDFEEEAWKNVADVIRMNNGVVTADQVAPYLVDAGTDNSIFPVLVRFDGIPEVTNTGNIVYTFPSIQQTATGPVFWKVPAFAEQREWKFSNVPAKRLDLVFYFAFANLTGWIAVANNFHRFDFLKGYKDIIGLLLMYALFFVGFPMLRCIYNDVRNAFIELNNNKRKRSADLLAKPDLQAKIQEAQAFAVALQYHAAQDAFYTTARDIDEQKLETDEQWLAANSPQPQAQPAT
jgi:hypothetical protein